MKFNHKNVNVQKVAALAELLVRMEQQFLLDEIELDVISWKILDNTNRDEKSFLLGIAQTIITTLQE